ncbi:RING-H2 finger protein ATL2-like [Raphanus sativus]|uniref:RING-type E3 ubiquitin transferase n=1 Tax=Raphanus sativus TaxID=3726 RepID=A0A9W3C0C5_RAPSA|nr:RING-H2 finger protein ATL2-like [Raphanus sativus]
MLAIEHDMLTTVSIAFSLLFLIYFTIHSLCDLWCLRRSRSHHIRRTMFFFAATDPSPASCGLDPAVLKSLPVFTFSDATHKDPIECAVCLSEFEEGETGRVLPGCKHAFHVECIDMWFHSHSTCPLCRSLVEIVTMVEEEEEEQIVIAISHEPVSATEPDSTSRSGSSFAGAPSQSRSSSCQIMMNESDIERGREEIK